VLAEAVRHHAQVVLIEDKGSGTHLIQDLRQDGLIRPIAILPEGDKVTRMAAQTAKIEAGHVLLPEQASWLQDFQTEILQFPNGRHDDQVDSLSQFLAWATRPLAEPRIRCL
jgi:predicted phage terminase large subunit-like protein